LDARVKRFEVAVRKHFLSSRSFIERTYPQIKNLELRVEEEDKKVNLRFDDGQISAVITIPIPFKTAEGIWLVSDNETLRPVGNYFIKEDFREVGFLGMMLFLLTENLQKIDFLCPSKTPLMQRIMWRFGTGNPAWTANLCQNTIDMFVHRLPLHDTTMNSWAVNKRVEFLDPEFQAIRNPEQKLEYQVKKNEEFWDLWKWSSIGLSESALSERNYLLKEDLKKTIPFGMKHHHPKRNLYQTLGMKGDEEPTITTEMAEQLANKGIKRGGKMLFTAFLDVPFNFEDHIIADNALMKLVSFHERRFQCFGEVKVKVGQNLKEGDVIAHNPDGEPVIFAVACDKAKVTHIIPRRVNIGGEEAKAFLVKVKVGRFLHDGTKFTNLHGNKGIASFTDVGFAIDPRTGKKQKIEVLVSATSVKRRGNFGQVLEALMTAMSGKDKKVVLPNDFATSEEKIKAALAKHGLPEDGMWEVETKWGKHKAICGWVFWGVIKDPENQLWTYQDTRRTDGRGRRIAGLKFSNIEMRAIITQFGPKNPIVDEILSHFQGTEDMRQMLQILKSCRGELPNELPTVNALDIPPVNTRTSMLKERHELAGTVGGDDFHPGGFVLKLPVKIAMLVPNNPLDGVRWVSRQNFHMEKLHDDTVFAIDKLFVPYFNLRTSWRHSSGKFGLSDIASLVNRVIQACHDFDSGEAEELAVARMVRTYLNTVARRLSTKRGELAQFGMAVRYPWSTKATATLAENLPSNTVEIHRDMAKDLKVRTGDVVLAERFPCLGFMSVRPQKVRVTDDPKCKFVIRVSGNSLVSQNLDFDGDVLYLASFHKPESKIALQKALENPPNLIKSFIDEANSKKKPQFMEVNLAGYRIRKFDDMTDAEHSLIVRRAVGVKSHTGPVIALAYNLMRIVESEVGYHNMEVNAQVEKMLDQLGNTVFSQKHGITPLHESTIKAVCLADADALVEAGFDRYPSQLICDIVVKKAKQVGIFDLEEAYRMHKEEGRSSVINVIVRRLNKIYFASRASLEPYFMLKNLESKPVDLPSHLFMRALQTSKSEAEERMLFIKRKLAQMKTENLIEKERLASKRFEELWKMARIQSQQIAPLAIEEQETEFWPEVRHSEIEVPFASSE
jgi:hypothetical protein